MRAVWFGFGVIVLLAVGAMVIAPKALHPGSSTNTATNHPTNSRQTNSAGTNTTLTNQSASSLTVAEVLAHPDQYSGQHICLQGYYQSSFEFSAFGATADLNAATIQRPYIWADIDPNLYTLHCQ